MIPSNSNFVIDFLINKRWQWLRHALLIVLVAQTFYLFSPEVFRENALVTNLSFKEAYGIQFLIFFVALFAIYFNLLVLFPLLFKKKHYFSYAIAILVLGVIFFFSSYFIQNFFIDHKTLPPEYLIKLSFTGFFDGALFPMVYITATTGYKVFKEWNYDQERFATLEKEKLKAELSQLKSQVNPHFLFNTLNNLQVLIQAEPKKATEIVLGLSDVLRYQIYDSQHEKVQLIKDINIIEQYLELEKIRRNDLTFKVLTHSNFNNIFVPPLLFINFIDNAIKHGNSREPSFIDMSFEVKDKYLYFEISNSKPNQKTQFESNGFGLENVKKRLDLLYGQNHSLDIIDAQSIYTVKLKFPI